MTSNETPDTILDWVQTNFGTATLERTIERAVEEMDELTESISLGCDRETVIEEAADVVIVLCNIPGLQDAINAKMAKNRARKWKVMGDGTAYHIKEPQP